MLRSILSLCGVLTLATLAHAQPALPGLPGQPATANQPAAAPADAAAPAAAPAQQVELRFDQDLFAPSDLMLQGITATDGLGFTRPARWELTEDPELRIRYDYSAALLPERSALTVRVNDKSVASVRLVRERGTGQYAEIVTRIPRELLQDYNRISFSVVQHVSDDCEDPFDPSLWTRIRTDSQILMSYREKDFESELQGFPYPFLDNLGYGPLTIAPAGSAGFSASQLEVMGQVGFALGRLAAYRGVDIQPAITDKSQATSHMLVVGTPADNPLVSEFVNTAGLQPGEGVVAALANPANPKLGILVVSGRDQEGLTKATQAITGQDRYQMLSGARASVQDVKESVPPKTRQDPLPIPDIERFTLQDLGIKDQTVRGYYAPPVKIPIRLPGDTKVRVDGARIDVDYAYAAKLDSRLSTMEVRLNGVTLRSVGLTNPEGQQQEEWLGGLFKGPRLRVDLPFELLEPTSELEVVFHLFPQEFGPCIYVTDKHIWGTVMGTSEVEILRDQYADMPDLSLLRHQLWPYNAALAASSTAIVTNDRPSGDDAAAAMQLAAEFGKVNTSERPNLKVVPSSQGALAAGSARHSIFLVGGNGHSGYDSLVSARAISTPGDMERALRDQSADLMHTGVGTPYYTLEQTLHPGDTQGTVLVARAPSSGELGRLVRHVVDSSNILRFEGNAAVISQDGKVASLNIRQAERRQLGEMSVWTRIQRTVGDKLWPLAVGIIIASAVLTWLIRNWAASQSRPGRRVQA